MEETPICDSVERDLEIDIDELTAGVADSGPASTMPTAGPTEQPSATSNV